MARQPVLTLAEELTLLALRDEKGTFQADLFEYTVAAALVSELILRHRITVDQEKKKLVNLVSPEKVGDPLLDECLERMHSAKRRASLRDWVLRLARLKKLRHRVALQLCQRGILKAEQDKVLLVFTRKIFPEIDRRPETALVETLRQAIFTDTAAVAPRTTVLISLAHETGLLKRVFDRKLLQGRKTRIEQLIKGELTGKAAKVAIQAVQAALFVVIMPKLTQHPCAFHKLVHVGPTLRNTGPADWGRRGTGGSSPSCA